MARIWDARSGKELVRLEGHTDYVVSAVFSFDGQRVVTASFDNTARIWDARNGKQLFTLRGHTDHVLAAAFSPDGRRVVTTAWDHIGRVWDTESGKQLTILNGHNGVVGIASFSPDSSKVATASDDGTARVWDVRSGKQLAELKEVPKSIRTKLPCPPIRSVQWSPNGADLLTVGKDRSVLISDATTGEAKLHLQGHSNLVTSASWSPDGLRIVTTCQDGIARVWDATTGDVLDQLSGHTDSLTIANWNFDGSKIVTASDDRTARIWDAIQLPNKATLDTDDGILTIKFGGPLHSPDRQRKVFWWSDDRIACIRNAATNALLVELKGHTQGVDCARWSPDGTRVVTGSRDGTIRLWDPESGAELLALPGYRCVCFSRDGLRLMTQWWEDPGPNSLVYDRRPVNLAVARIAPMPRAK